MAAVRVGTVIWQGGVALARAPALKGDGSHPSAAGRPILVFANFPYRLAMVGGVVR
jgi:hypothetical protein